jgi:hypothetical protein
MGGKTLAYFIIHHSSFIIPTFSGGSKKEDFMNLFYTILLGGISFLFLICGFLWTAGKGGFLMRGWNTKSKEDKERYDERAFLRFNGRLVLAASILGTLAAILVLLGHTWAFSIGLVVLIVPIVAGNFYSLRSKRFLKSDAPEVAVDLDDPKKVRERKTRTIVSIVGIAVIAIPMAWIIFEGMRPIDAGIDGDNFRVRGIYGLTVALDDILEVELDERSMAEIGSGGRRVGHGTATSWRGRFGAGHLLIQNPDEGPTIRIERRGESTIFISLADPALTEDLYYDIIGAWR